jgi:hypothetical protein
MNDLNIHLRAARDRISSYSLGSASTASSPPCPSDPAAFLWCCLYLELLKVSSDMDFSRSG